MVIVGLVFWLYILIVLSEAVIQRCSVKKCCTSTRPATVVKRRLWRRCFPANFVKFLRKPFFIEHIWWLLLCCKCSVRRSFNYKQTLFSMFYILNCHFQSWTILTILAKSLRKVITACINISYIANISICVWKDSAGSTMYIPSLPIPNNKLSFWQNSPSKMVMFYTYVS